MSWRLVALAPAKINLGLFVGRRRAIDGRHELVSVMQSISLADERTLEPGDSGADDDLVVCPGVLGPPGENLAAVALRLFRSETGWDGQALRLSIDKRIPVAAGLGGGSADAAAALRLAAHVSGRGSPELLRELATRLGADVPAQLVPGRWLARGAGERLRELAPAERPFGALVLPLAAELSAGAVYERLDEIGGEEGVGGRSSADLEGVERRLRAAYQSGTPIADEPELLKNDLQAAAISLCPGIEAALEEALGAGADVAFVSGSGPTVIGLFKGTDGPGRARRAAAGLVGRVPAASWATPVEEGVARVNDLAVRHNPRR
jgi:4-diphosphocytidyl-2-C-methyl-D-erythritol kinase